MNKALSDALFRSLSERWMPEQVAKAILEARRGDYQPNELALLKTALPRWQRSSMASTFECAVGMRKQVATAAKLFKAKEPPHEFSAVRAFIDSLRAKMKLSDGLDFKADRAPRAARRKKGLLRSHRAYNKRFRMLARLEEKFTTWGETHEILQLAQVAKSRLAIRITRAVMNDVETACFLAWMTARLNVRSMFTFGKQERAFDKIAEMLLARVPKRVGALAAVALVHPSADVIAKLSDDRKGWLLGEWFAVMRRGADVLERVAKRDKPDLESLIVRRGNDSSTWNAAAGAYNKARDGWIATLYALGMEDALESLAPGKAMRLMAADVAWGHRSYGKGLDPDTRVWGLLPKPWEVLSGKRICNRQKIEKACDQVETPHGGWIKPRAQVAVAYKPTPELVQDRKSVV